MVGVDVDLGDLAAFPAVVDSQRVEAEVCAQYGFRFVGPLGDVDP